MTDRIALEAPLDSAVGAVIRLIVGGIAERAGFGFEDMDDLQLAIERLLAEAGLEGRVALAFELGDDQICAHVGPLRAQRVSAALQDLDESPGRLTLARILATVVSSFGVEAVADGQVVGRLEKLAGVRA